MKTVHIALGSNLGDREANLRAAIEKMATKVQVTKQSGVYETDPWGITDQPLFLNMTVAGETGLQAEELLDFLKNIEAELGRTAGVRYGPRQIDLDMLLYDGEVIHTQTLTIPHPGLTERRFVLVPLAEIAAGLVHPVSGIPIADILARLPDTGEVRYLGPLSQ